MNILNNEQLNETNNTQSGDEVKVETGNTVDVVKTVAEQVEPTDITEKSDIDSSSITEDVSSTTQPSGAQIDIFGMMKSMGQSVPDSVQVNEPKKEIKKADKKKAKTAVSKKKEAEKFELPINIYYAGFPHAITKEEYPEKEFLERKEILHHLQNNFNYRVLTEKRTHLEYDKDSNMLVVHLKNPSKGSFFGKMFNKDKGFNNGITIEQVNPISQTKQPMLSTTPYQFGIHRYGFDDNTIRFVKFDTYGYFIGPVETGHEESCLPAELPGAYLFEKIPNYYLQEIVEDFKNFYPKERLAQLFFNRKTNELSIYFPEQFTTTSSIQRYNEKFFNKDYNNVLIMEIHSHGDYGAYFSMTDDANELDFLIYGVIGNLDSERPTSEFRLGFNGEFHTISIADVFDLNINEEELYA